MTGQTISHYRVLEKLGEGGMGVVYKAEDTKLRRTVALKFLPPDNRERFLREAQAAAALNHPNICTVFEIDEEHGFLAMELIDGMSVKDKIAARPLPLEEALDIAQQACAGLAAAHEKGIVHRDIKPANLMLTAQGQVKIMDFGLAQVGDRTRITKTGSSLGTPAYMSPEQAQGNAVDRRTDIWSLGVVLYEMLTGRLPFRGDTEQAVAYGIVHAEPEPLTAVRSGVPKELDRVVAKALRKPQTGRYAHVEDLAVDLRHVQAESPSRRERTSVRAVLAAAALALAAVCVWLMWRSERVIESLAVLPFVTAPGTDIEYLGDGITDNLIDTLSQVPRLRVIGRGTMFRFKGRDADPRTVASELNVDAVITGGVALREGRVVVNVEMVSASDGARIWGSRYDRVSSAMLSIQDELAREIAAQLQRHLGPDKLSGPGTHTTANAEAYQSYLKGLYQWNKRTPSSVRQAIVHFQDAIEKDPAYALAYAGMAEAYSVLVVMAVEPSAPKAKAAAMRAVELGDSLAEAHTALGHVLFRFYWDWAGAEKEFQRALALNSNYAVLHHRRAIYLAALGRHGEAIEAAKRAQDLDPLSPTIHGHLAWQYYAARRNAEALAEIRRVLSSEPDFGFAHAIAGLIHNARREYQEALRELRKAAPWPVDEGLVRAETRTGNRESALKRLAEIEARAAETYVSPWRLGRMHADLGNLDRAFQLFNQACDEHAEGPYLFNSSPDFDDLRSDPRFAALVRRIGLDPAQKRAE